MAATTQPTAECVKRLRLEWRELLRSPIDQILTAPDPDDILTWFYVLLGSTDTPFEGGVYFGKLLFKPTYPFSPPGIVMRTPSGRFKPDTRLCLSISDYHPESWSPSWSVGSILVGLLSFMLESTITAGSIESTDDEKRRLAALSLDFNRTIPEFRRLFPQLCEEDAV